MTWNHRHEIAGTHCLAGHYRPATGTLIDIVEEIGGGDIERYSQLF